MTRVRRWVRRANVVDLWMTLAAVAIAVLMIVAATQVQAQTYNIIHTFGGPDGSYPQAGLTKDAAGNLYGTTPGEPSVKLSVMPHCSTPLHF